MDSATRRARAHRRAAIETHLRQEYRYDLDSPSGAAKNPLDDFLFESKRGHCEFYSTAMAVMLRTLGVPTRNVTGFIGGTYNRFGRYYAVRQGDAHSWVEVYVDGRGWMRFDPTPPSDAAPQSEITGVFAFVRDFVEAAAQRWNRHVVGYDLKQQISLFRNVRNRYSSLRSTSSVAQAISSPRRIALLLVGVGLCGMGIWWLRRGRRKQSTDPKAPTPAEVTALRVVALYKSLEAALAQVGAPRPPSVPPLAHAVALEEMGHPAGKEARELTLVYLEARFGGRELDDDDRRDFSRRVRGLKVGPERARDAA